MACEKKSKLPELSMFGGISDIFFGQFHSLAVLVPPLMSRRQCILTSQEHVSLVIAVSRFLNHRLL